MAWAALKEGWAQVEGGESHSLFHSSEAPPGALCPALGFPAREGPGAAGMSPEEATEKLQGANSSVLRPKGPV